jgi:LysR family hydrogen peroxide-inducible transcriptional activator
MVWRKSSPLAAQLQQISEVVRLAADALRAPKGDGGVKDATKRAAGARRK